MTTFCVVRAKGLHAEMELKPEGPEGKSIIDAVNIRHHSYYVKKVVN